MKIANEALFREALLKGYNLFVGAGFSLRAKNTAGEDLLIGARLRDRLVSDFGLQKYKNTSLSQLSTLLQKQQPEQLKAKLVELFSVGDFDPRYGAIERTAVRQIFTTNIDNLLFKVFKDSKAKHLSNTRVRGRVAGDSSAVLYTPLHGCVESPEEGFVFATTEIADAFNQRPSSWYDLSNGFARVPTIVWGYSAADAGFLAALSDESQTSVRQNMWITLLPAAGERTEAEVSVDRDYFEALGFSIVECYTEELLEFLEECTGEPKATEGSFEAVARSVFSPSVVPSPNQYPVRPLSEFLSGDDPQWSDAYSPSVHRTQFVRQTVNAIAERQNTILVGIPACGKSTVLMQSAVDSQTTSTKLYFKLLTVEQAAQISNASTGQQITVFIDDISDSSEAAQYLVDHIPGCTIVGADREYQFDIVSHRFPTRSWQIVNISETSDNDVASVINTLPGKAKFRDWREVRRLRWLSSASERFSLFEAVQHFMRDEKASVLGRVNRMLTHDFAADVDARELMVASAYVHMCRTPFSIDMILSFLGSGYRSAQNVVAKLGNMISNYDGTDVDTNQDHFAFRSKIAASAILKAAPRALFSSAFTRFHANVQREVVCRFDIFRKAAYDAEYVQDAYSSVDEGVAFYRRSYQRDRSYYLKQQCALYLARNQRFKEAFQYIDEALRDSGARVPAIMHSHAFILFGANLADAQRDPSNLDIRRLLDESMAILARCYDRDRRKRYHANSYGDQALKYHEIYRGDSKAREYLQRAKTWLESEAKQAQWHHQTAEHLKRVDIALRRM